MGQRRNNVLLDLYKPRMWGVVKVMDLIEMKTKVLEIVHHNLNKYIGGEVYFDNLDEQIKNDEQLICSYINHIVYQEGINNVIVSGEIGNKIKRYQDENKLSKNINLFLFPGGLRKNTQIDNLKMKKFENKKCILFDDSYYSGKTVQKISNVVQKHNGCITSVYVVYDGSRINTHNVHSLCRYYDMRKCENNV